MSHLPRPTRPAASLVAAAGLALLLLGGPAACTTVAKPVPPNASVGLTSVSGGWANGAGADLELRINYEFEALELQIDGVWITVSTAGLPGLYRYHWNPADLTEGRFPMTARGVAAGGTKMSNTVVVVLDRTPPQIVSRTPAADGAGWPGEPVSITFSEPMKVIASGSASMTSAVRGANVAGYVELDEAATTLRFRHFEPLVAPDELLLRLAGKVGDRAGNLVPETVWSVSLRTPWVVLGGGAVPGAGVHPDVSDLGAPTLFLASGALHVAPSVNSSGSAKLVDGAWQEVSDSTGGRGVTTDGTDLLTASMPVRRWSGAGWETVTTNLTPEYSYRKVLWAASGPASAWIEQPVVAPGVRGDAALFGAVWDGASWLQPPPVGQPGFQLSVLDLQVSDGALHALYFDGSVKSDASQTGGLRVARLEAAGWTVLPGSIPGATLTASLGADLWVARVMVDFGLETWRPGSGGWALTGPARPLGSWVGAASPCITADAAGVHYLAYLIDALDARPPFRFTAVHLLRGDGATWEEPWGVLNLNPLVKARTPRVLIDVDGSPIVAWREVVTGTDGVEVLETFVKRMQL